MFSGLMPAMVTPFDERGEVDLEAAEAVVERFIEAGVSGISPLGSTGEFSHLTAEERKRFAEGVVSIVGGRVPVLVGVGAPGTREAVELARHAEGVGADGVLVVTPFYWIVGEEALFTHFAAVARAVGIPVLIYNLPMLTGVDLSPSLVARVAGECPNVVGLKDTVTEYSHTVNVLREVKPGRPDFSVLAGFEDLILPSVLAGGDGSICGLANVAPELFVGMVRCAQNGELEEAVQMHRRRPLAAGPRWPWRHPAWGHQARNERARRADIADRTRARHDPPRGKARGGRGDTRRVGFGGGSVRGRNLRFRVLGFSTRTRVFPSVSCAASRRHQDQQCRPRGSVRRAGQETAGLGIGGVDQTGDDDRSGQRRHRDVGGLPSHAGYPA